MRPRDVDRGAAAVRWIGMCILAALLVAAFGAGSARAYVVHGDDGRLYGVLPAPSSVVARVHSSERAASPKVSYWGGDVMLSSTLHLIFWGPPGSFAASYQGSITQWAQDLAADSGRTTNEFSIASLYYTTHPRRQISRNVYFGGAVSDPQPYPASGCTNQAKPRRTCLSSAQLRAEIRRVILAQGWPRDDPRDPRNQYLLFTPIGVETCQDRQGTTCTYGQNVICGYHSSLTIRRQAVVYSILPNVPSCPSGQAPSGVQGNPNADGAVDSGIHEVLESATDPGSRGSDDWGWADNPGNEIGDLCSPNDTVYGPALGGSLPARTAFNQLMASHAYYTQEIWAIPTRGSPAGCAQRLGPSPVFTARPGKGRRVSFDASRSRDLVGRITRYAWNYGDGAGVDARRGARTAHAYRRPGSYLVSLTVVDGSGPGNASTQTHVVVVR